MAEITLRLGLHDAGCLPVLLTREIEAVERSVRVLGPGPTEDDRALTAAYLAQLRACLAAVEKARA